VKQHEFANKDMLRSPSVALVAQPLVFLGCIVCTA